MLYYTFESIKYSPYTALYRKPNTSKHKVQFWKITYSVNGQSEVYLNGKRYTLKNNTLLFVKPQDILQTSSYDSDDYVHRDIYISDARLKEICSSLPYNPYNELLGGNTFIEVARQQVDNLEYILNSFPLNSEEKNDYLDTLHQSVIVQCLSMFVHFVHTVQKAPLWLVQLADRTNSLEYLKNGVDFFLSDLPYSRRQIRRYFLRYYGMTPSAYLTKAKIIYSANLLMNKELLIVNIAQMLGFDTQSGFIKAFKKYFDISPNSWRKKYLTDKFSGEGNKYGDVESI